MNNTQDNSRTGSSVVTFSNIPLDDEPVVIGYDSIPPEPELPDEVTVIGVQFKKGGKIYYFDPGSIDVTIGTEVIIDTSRGAEYGFCAEANHTVPSSKVVQPLRPLIRIATDNDKRTREEYKSREAAAFDLCQDKILDRKLDMKLVSAEYSFDGSKILFYFTADGRVDFRELVKDLAGVFRTRIELRQIGVRDEAKMMGGLGICGRPFCCKQFLDDFQPVSIKMAKTQNLSLNPTKISGTCGRLMCCLKYEQDAYESLIKSSPKQDSIVNTVDGKGTVTEVNLLKESVKVRLDSDPSTIRCYQNCDICVLRNGKAKKTDPPIPDDIPPLERPAAAPEEAASNVDEGSRTLRRSYHDSERSTGRSLQSERTERRKSSDSERAPRPERTERPERSEKSDTAVQPAESGTEPKGGASKSSRRNQRGGKRSVDGRKQSKGAKPADQQSPGSGSASSEKSAEKTAERPAEKAGEKTGEKAAASGRSRNSRRRYYRGKKPSGNKPSGQGQS